MVRFLLGRLLQIPVLLLLVSVIIFALIRVTPGDPVRIMLGTDTDPTVEQALRHQLHLDEPLPAQYVQWLGGAVRGDLGRSIRSHEPVVRLLLSRLSTTLSLAVLAMLVALLIAVPVGILAATHHNSPLDYGLMFVATIFWSIPNFVIAIVLVLVVAVRLQWLPITWSDRVFSDPLHSWRYVLMPVLALGLSRAAVMARMLRSGLLEVLRQDYVRTASAKGLRHRTVIRRHALPNALIPIVTVAAINFGYLLGGTVVIEQVFNISGMGTLLLQAVSARDFPVIQGVALFTALAFIIVNFAADLAAAALNPRIRES